MPPTQLPAVSLSLEQRIANLENICGIGAVDSVPCALFNVDGQIFPPQRNWYGAPPCIGLFAPGDLSYSLPAASDYLGTAFTIISQAPNAFTVNGALMVDGVSRSVATFNRTTGASFTIMATGQGWVVQQASGVSFS